MNEKHKHRDNEGGRDDDLSRLLRDGDPAGADIGLDPVELANMRQVITASVEHAETGTPWAGTWAAWTKPALAAAAVAVVAMGVWMFNGNLAGEAPEVADLGVTEPGPTPTQPGAEAAIAPDSVPDAETAPAPEATIETNAFIENTAIPPKNAAVASVDAPSPADKQARTVQFTAPRGTRIIWTLDPNFESPIAGQEPRQEQSQ